MSGVLRNLRPANTLAASVIKVIRKNDLVQKRFAYSENALKITDFKKDRDRIMKKYSTEKMNVKETLLFQVDDKPEEINKRNLMKFVRLSEDKKDLSILIYATKKMIAYGALTEEEIRGHIVTFMRLVHVLNESDAGLELFNDQSLIKYTHGTYAALILMNKLLIENRFDDVLELFEKQLAFYSAENSFSRKSVSFFKQAIPFDHLDVVCEALFKLNSSLALNKLKELFKFLKEKKSNLSQSSTVRSFLLAIKQNDPDFGRELIFNVPMKIDLRLNLEIISLCQLNLVSEAFLMADEMFNIVSNQQLKFSGKFFPFTIVKLAESIERSGNNDYFGEKLKNLNGRLQAEKRVSSRDLDEYCNNLRD